MSTHMKEHDEETSHKDIHKVTETTTTKPTTTKPATT